MSSVVTQGFEKHLDRIIYCRLPYPRSRDSRVLKTLDADRFSMPNMIQWLSNQIVEYEDTRSLKMYAHIREPGEVPTFELEPTEHQLSQEYHHGITAERVKEIMRNRLKETSWPSEG